MDFYLGTLKNFSSDIKERPSKNTNNNEPSRSSAQNTTNIPQSLDECIVPHPTAQGLLSWANLMMRWAEVLFCLLVIAGVLCGLIGMFTMPDGNIFTRIFCLLLSTLLGLGCGFVVFWLFQKTSLVISALGFITQDSAITAKVALYEATITNE